MSAYKPPQRGRLPEDLRIRLTDKHPRPGTGRAKAYAAIARSETVGDAIRALRVAGEHYFTQRLKRRVADRTGC